MNQPYNRASILQSVQKGLRILHLFTREKPVWGTTEIAAALELNKSTVSRLISDLLAEGYLQKEQNKYCLGYSLLYLSGVITSHLEIQRESKDIIKELVNHIGEAAHIAVLEGTGITYVHKAECQNPVELLSFIGRKNPVSCTSSGQVLLAFHKDNVIDYVIDAGLPRMGPNSVTDPEQFRSRLQQVKRQGYSICKDEMHENVVSIAAPIRDYTGEVVAAVSTAGTNQRINLDKIDPFKEAIIQAGKEISLQLGYIPGAYEKELTVK